MNLVTLENVSKQFSKRVLLDSVNRPSTRATGSGWLAVTAVQPAGKTA
jgi:hypothetical protein